LVPKTNCGLGLWFCIAIDPELIDGNLFVQLLHMFLQLLVVRVVELLMDVDLEVLWIVYFKRWMRLI